MTLFSGLSAFPVTPADEDGRVGVEHLQRLVARLVDADVQSIGVLGSTGRYPYLSGDERARALAAAIEAAGPVPVLAGIGALSTVDVLRHARDAEAAGAAGVLLAPVSYLPLTDDEVLFLTRDVAGATELPIVIYNNPGTTHFDVSEDLLLRLAEIPTVRAVKNRPPQDGKYTIQINRLRLKLPADFSIGYSGDATIAKALSAGVDCWYSVLAGTCPEICRAMWQVRDDATALAALDDRLTPLWSLFNRHGGIRVVHEAVGLLGLGAVTPPRPLLPLPHTVRTQIAEALQSAGLLQGENA